MVILNTCHIREKASEKVFSELGRLRPGARRAARNGADMIIAVAGCVAQAEGAEILRRAPEVDIVLGPQTYHRLPEMVARAPARARSAKDGLTIAAAPACSTPIFRRNPNSIICRRPLPNRASRPSWRSRKAATSSAPSASCPIRAARNSPGPSRRSWRRRGPGRGRARARSRCWARTSTPITAKRRLDPSGAWAAWCAISPTRVDGLLRIRYTTSHPRDMDDDLIAAHAEVPQLMPFLHLPVQSGSDRVLEAMNRQHKARRFYDIVEQLRAARADMALSSDFIVGFPGESDDRFRRDHEAGGRDRLRPGLLVQIQHPARHARRAPWRTRCPKP